MSGKVRCSCPLVQSSPLNCFSAHAEADTFFCFTSLMTEIGDKFTKKLDSSRAGIGQEIMHGVLYFCVMSLFSRWFLAEHDDAAQEQRPTATCSFGESPSHLPLVDLYLCMTLQVKNGIDATFFGFRWITLLLSQEFLLPGNSTPNHTLFYYGLYMLCRGHQNMGFLIC